MRALLFVAVLSSWVISPASLQDAYSADVHMYPEGEDYCPATGSVSQAKCKKKIQLVPLYQL